MSACAQNGADTATPGGAASRSEVTVTSGATPEATQRADEAAPDGALAPGVPSITIAAVGDLMLDRDVETQMASEGALYPFERVLPMFEGADLLIGNLEGALTDRGEPLDKKYTFRTTPSLAEGLALAGFDAVSLANNHSFDFGTTGLLDTVDALEGVGVAAVGGGADEAAAYAPAVFEVAGQTVAVLGFNAIGGTSVARVDAPGVAWADEDALASVRAASEAADHVVVMVHAGIEYSAEPSAEQREFARSLIEAGADVVVVHHPHALQPWERYRDGLILHSLGNFVFDLDAEDLETLGSTPFESAIAMVTLSEGQPPQVVLRPVMIDLDENRPRPATAEELPAIVARVGTEWRWQALAADGGWTTNAPGSVASASEPPVTPTRAESPSRVTR